jgi:hypothetical protein
MRFTNAEKQREIERELNYRRRVYDRLVAEGRMSGTESKRRISIIEEIAGDYAVLAERDAPQLWK